MGNTCDPGRDRFWEAMERFEYVERRSLAYEDDRCRIGGCGFTVLSVIIGGKTAKFCDGSVVEVMVAVMRVLFFPQGVRARREREKKKKKRRCLRVKEFLSQVVSETQKQR